MSRTYQWRATTKYASTTTLSYGVSPTDKMNWQTTEIGNDPGSETFTWWYRDSNLPLDGVWTDARSTRVAIHCTETWTTTVDDWNYLTVTFTAQLGPIVRDDVRGDGGGNGWSRLINFYSEEGGPNILSLTDTLVGEAHTIYTGPLTYTHSVTIPPGGNHERSTFYVHNQTIGRESWDDIWTGIQFRNTLPAYYRPAATYSGGWNSCDRSGGACNVYDGTNWREMKTIYGGVDTSKPPKILHSNNTYYNQRRVGNG